MNSSTITEPTLLPNKGFKLTDIYFQLFCERNSDGTKHLRLKGKDIYQRLGKRLNHMDMLAVSLFLRAHPEVVSVDLCYNDIGDTGLEILTENYLNKGNSLVDLNLMSNDITFHGLSKLYKVSDKLKLRTLRLNGNKLGKRGGQYASKLIECVPTLELIELGDTDQNLASIDSILESTRKSKLKVLDISRVIPNSKYEQLDPTWMAKNVGHFLEVNTNLVEIHLEKNEMDGHDMEKLIHGLRDNNSLRLLNICANRIGSYGLMVISKWLSTNPALYGLDVSCNQITNSGARALSYGMCNSKLKFLNISYNKIGDDGVTSILDTLKKPYQMVLFYIYGNGIGNRSLKVLQRMLLSGVLKQEFIDTKLYEVDGELQAAYYPTNHFKQQYYSVMTYGCPVFLEIKKNRIDPNADKCKPFYSLPYYKRYPDLDKV